MAKIARITLFSFGHLAMVGILLVLGGCSCIAHRITEESQPLTYVGKISFGTPVREGHRIAVPLSFSGGEWLKNSAIGFCRAESRVSDREIVMTVTTALAGDKNPPTPQLFLKDAPAGEYLISYQDPDGAKHKLGTIAIP